MHRAARAFWSSLPSLFRASPSNARIFVLSLWEKRSPQPECPRNSFSTSSSRAQVLVILVHSLEVSFVDLWQPTDFPDTHGLLSFSRSLALSTRSFTCWVPLAPSPTHPLVHYFLDAPSLFAQMHHATRSQCYRCVVTCHQCNCRMNCSNQPEDSQKATDGLTRGKQRGHW